uniref:Uncharacterized protein n=1 Tax=Octactis speculum TaxID=3111310 RepID=A0A7S2FVV5_9STRA|mmetsp:Transcript_31840/g.43119  ORF Transcript_31840/g.43119 Transcript_31840/m.43119 type:complete len:297 (+) Transcript_31840:77-967(+)
MQQRSERRSTRSKSHEKFDSSETAPVPTGLQDNYIILLIFGLVLFFVFFPVYFMDAFLFMRTPEGKLHNEHTVKAGNLRHQDVLDKATTTHYEKHAELHGELVGVQGYQSLNPLSPSEDNDIRASNQFEGIVSMAPPDLSSPKYVAHADAGSFQEGVPVSSSTNVDTNVNQADSDNGPDLDSVSDTIVGDPEGDSKWKSARPADLLGSSYAADASSGGSSLVTTDVYNSRLRGGEPPSPGDQPVEEPVPADPLVEEELAPESEGVWDETQEQVDMTNIDATNEDVTPIIIGDIIGD